MHVLAQVISSVRSSGKQSGPNTVSKLRRHRCPYGIVAATCAPSSQTNTPEARDNIFRENAADVQTTHQLHRPLDDQGSGYDRRIRALRAGGTPRPESQAIRAHVPATFWSFANTWRDVFKNGVADHKIKELCRIYVSRSVLCEFCGNQRSIKAAKAGLKEDDYSDLINFESSTRYDERQKAALAYAEAITWDLPATDELWDRLHKHFSEPELVEIGYFVAITMGQQRWLRTLNIEHHQILAGTDASMAPGFETADALKRSKEAEDYWARIDGKPSKQAAE